MYQVLVNKSIICSECIHHSKAVCILHLYKSVFIYVLSIGSIKDTDSCLHIKKIMINRSIEDMYVTLGAVT